MPEVTINIGGRSFDVACQEGEQPFLESAAALLDAEAQVLTQQIGRIPELRLLLMSGLMLADKTAGLEDQLAILKDKLASHEALIEELSARKPASTDPVVPADSVVALTNAVELAEKLAEAS
ncbi:MAG: cell division protein ZapA [Pseudomonadota bacterium]